MQDGNYRHLSGEERPKSTRFSLARLGSFLGGKAARENYRIARTAYVFLSDAYRRTHVESSHPVLPLSVLTLSVAGLCRTMPKFVFGARACAYSADAVWHSRA